MTFEFDTNKSKANKRKHGIDFDEAQSMWGDPNRIALSRDFIMSNGMALLPVLAAGCGAQYTRIGEKISESFQ
jgi:hypothetical protein